MANPTLLTTPFCVSGEKNEIPAMQPSQGDGRFNQYTGFPAETSIPTINGGKNVSRKDMNGAFYFLSNILFQVQKGKIFEWVNTQAYYTPALILDNNVVYFCKANAPIGTVQPRNDTAHTYWISLADYIKSQMTISYTEILGRPTAVSAFTNDRNYQTASDVTTTLTPYATQAFVNSSINALASYYITKNAEGDPFGTRAELMSATAYYSGGVARTPTRNDYAVVLADENYGGHSTRYSYNNGWEYQYTYNMQFTQAQIDALNSGVTSTVVAQVATNTTAIAGKANTSDLDTIAFDGLPVATSGVLGGVKKGNGIIVSADGTLSVDTSGLIAAIDWTQLNISEKMHNNGSSGIINLTNGRVQVTTATTITMPVPPQNCATWVTLWCNNGSVTFDSTYAPVYLEDGNEPPSGTGVFVYTLASIGGNGWYCLFTGVYNNN